MTDPVANNEQEPKEDQVENFGWWVCMLPFVVGAGVFAYQWWIHRLEPTGGMNLLYGFGCLILGVLLSAAVAGGSEDKGTGSGGSGQ